MSRADNNLSLENLVADLCAYDPARFIQLGESEPTASKLLTDLPKQELEKLNSRSRASEHLTKYAAWAIVTQRLREDNYFVNCLDDISTLDSVYWFLYEYNDGTEIPKSLPGDSPHLLNIPRNYPTAWQVPPAFLLWLKKYKGTDQIPKKLKDIARLYMRNKREFIADSIQGSLHPMLYETNTTGNGIITASLAASLLDPGASLFFSRRCWLDKCVDDIHKLLFLALDLALHSKDTTKMFACLGSRAINTIRKLNVRSNYQCLPAFPLTCYLATFAFNAKQLNPKDLAKEGSNITRSRLDRWFLETWIATRPSSLYLFDLESTEFIANRTISEAKTLSINEILISAHWDSSSGLTKNAQMTLEAFGNSSWVSRKVMVDLPRVINAYQAGINRELIIHCNADESPLAVLRHKSYLSNLHCQKTNGFYLWETSKVPLSHELGVTLVDTVLVPSEFLLKAYSKFSPAAYVRNVGKFLSVSLNQASADIAHLVPEQLLDNSNIYKFITVFDGGSGIERKNPLALVKAYIHQFAVDSSTHLLIKANIPKGDHWGDPFSTMEQIIRIAKSRSDITIIDHHLSQEELYSIIKFSDAVVSPHRSEGFGYLMLEAILLNKPLIASGYSGFPIKADMFSGYHRLSYKMIPMPNGKFYHDSSGQVWADVNKHELQQALQVFAERRIRRFANSSVEELGRAEIVHYYSKDSYYKRLRTQV